MWDVGRVDRAELAWFWERNDMLGEGSSWGAAGLKDYVLRKAHGRSRDNQISNLVCGLPELQRSSCRGELETGTSLCLETREGKCAGLPGCHRESLPRTGAVLATFRRGLTPYLTDKPGASMHVTLLPKRCSPDKCSQHHDDA